ncbi:MAG: hypothetical protein CSA21_06410 [Deltaproteobacteria bacterium]|nr:MAG: hypothetical protein CSA21_06410 [Deltaproteobacteria bacterium]
MVAILSLSCLLAILIGPATYVLAEERNVEMDTITVTAGKRTDAITDLSASVSLMSKQEIDREHIESIDDFQSHFANVHVQSAGGATNSFLSIRGVVGQSVPLTPSGIGIYVDEVSLIDPLSNLLASAYFFDLDRIEVLRGPQGTLYGRNAEAGVLVVRTKDPEHRFSAKFLGEVGNYDALMSCGIINLPLIENKAAARFSASYSNRDGYTENISLGKTAAGIDEFNVRGKLLWDIRDTTSLIFTAENYHVRDGAQDLVPFSIAGPDWDKGTINTDVDGHEHRDMTALSLRLNHAFDWSELVSITAYRDGKESTLGDPDFWSYQTGYADFTLNQKQFSQEFRLISSAETLPWKWLAGLYFYNNDIDFESLYHMEPAGVDMITVGDGKNMGAALFGDIEYAFSSGFRLGGGIRAQHYKDELASKRSLAAFGMENSDDTSNDYNQLMGKINLAYDFDSATVYGLISQGSRAGGIVSLMQTDKMHHYEPETAISYEAGFKYYLPDEWGYVDAAFFVTDIKDLHVSTTGNGGFQYVSNAGKARNIGGEVQLNMNLHQNLTASASLGYVDTELKDYKGDKKYSGKHVPRVPDMTGMLAVQYDREITSGIFLVGRASYHHIGKVYWDLANTNKEKPYGLVNTTLGLEGDWWRVYLWGKNLTNEEYVRTAVMWGNMAVGAYGAPRTFGGTVQFML